MFHRIIFFPISYVWYDLCVRYYYENIEYLQKKYTPLHPKMWKCKNPPPWSLIYGKCSQFPLEKNAVVCLFQSIFLIRLVNFLFTPLEWKKQHWFASHMIIDKTWSLMTRP